MLKTFKIVLLTLLLQPLLVFGHADHDHEHEAQPISATQAQSNGLKAAKVFSDIDAELGFGKLPQSWSKLSSAQTKLHASGKGYYVVAVENEAEGKTLYVLMSNTGDLYDANFTGEFPKLNP